MTSKTLEFASTRINDLSAEAFARLRKIVYDQSGISLKDNKMALMKARVTKRLRTLRLSSFEEYIEYLDKDERELGNLLDVVSTNVTSFFRELHHFQFLESLVKGWISEGRRKIRVWSCGCSSGEEPYSLAIELMEVQAKESKFDFKILATDIASSALHTCLRGEYDSEKVEGISKDRLVKYFDKSEQEDGSHYTIKPQVRELLLVRKFNLMSFPYPLKNQVDVVFCRNVMIYFDRITKERIIREFQRLIRSGGYLFVGHAESLARTDTGFISIRPTIYKRV